MRRLITTLAAMMLAVASGLAAHAQKADEILESGREAIAERRQALQTEYKVRTTRIQIPLDAPEA